MSALDDRIAQFQKMTAEDPKEDLGHFRLGQAYLEAGRLEEAEKSLRRTLELSPQFSLVFQFLGKCLLQLNQKEQAIQELRKGYQIASERGENRPRDEMAKMLIELGETPPAPPAPKKSVAPAGSGGFHCQRPGCVEGEHARQLARPPMSDEMGRRIYDTVCAECWNYWLRNASVKVINEMRLDLSTDQGQETYDQIMRETLGLS